MATENSKKKIPPESARAEVEDDSSVNNTVTDPGLKQTTRTTTSTTPETRQHPGPTFQRCSCGWAKVTSLTGLPIHQGGKKCLKAVVHRTHIDHYFLWSKPNQSNEVQQQDQPRSLRSINTNVTEEVGESNTGGIGEPRVPQPQPATERNIQGQRPPIKWPKSHERSEWEMVNSDWLSAMTTL